MGRVNSEDCRFGSSREDPPLAKLTVCANREWLGCCRGLESGVGEQVSEVVYREHLRGIVLKENKWIAVSCIRDNVEVCHESGGGGKHLLDTHSRLGVTREYGILLESVSDAIRGIDEDPNASLVAHSRDDLNTFCNFARIVGT